MLMQQYLPILIQIGSGLLGFAVLILSGIWKEVRKLNEKVQDVSVMIANQHSRIDSLEKVVNKLPCISNLTCPKGDRNVQDFYT